jgi:starch synthase
MQKTIRILFLAAEAAPFVKVGGLGDVAGALPIALRNLSENGTTLDVRLAIPLHSVVRTHADTLRPVAAFSLPHSGKEIPAQIFETRLQKMPVYFISGAPISAGGSVYSSNENIDSEKYTFFSLAALEMIRQLDWKPDILHANDWHTALAVYALLLRRWEDSEKSTRTVLTIHNLPFLGPDILGRMDAYGLPLAQTDLPPWAQTRPLPLGLWSADALTTVSPSYAEAIQSDGDESAGLGEFLRQRREDLHGILNGIDVDSYNPATDSALAAPFGAETLYRRLENKRALQNEMGLPNSDAPLFGIVSRMDSQKGMDVAFSALRRLKGSDWQAVILGTGDRALESAARRLHTRFPKRVGLALRYDSALARRIYGGADFFLMPSRYEPCGLAQMIAMRYGCLPIARETGGLKDTIRESETGFLFPAATAASLLKAMRRAMAAYSDPETIETMQRAAMAQDFSWGRAAKEYLALYRSLLDTPMSSSRMPLL